MTDQYAPAAQVLDQDHLVIDGGIPLTGEVRITGAKNAALPALVAACLSDGPTVLRNVPLDLADVKLMLLLLNQHGAKVERIGDDAVACDGRGWRGGAFDAEMSSKFRHVLLLMGLSAFRGVSAQLGRIGGCALGDRRHDFHAQLFRDFGLDVVDNGAFRAMGRMRAGEVVTEFPYPSFGATLNFLYTALGRPGETAVLKSAALNPEVQDVVHLLQSMGADIAWSGPDGRELRVRGAERLNPTDYSIMGDRIVAATVAAAVTMTDGDAVIRGVEPRYLSSEFEVWQRCGMGIEPVDNGFRVTRARALTASDIETRAYPAFHTDMQPLHGVLMTMAEGESRIRDTILDSRFKYCSELARMGAKAEVVDGGFTCVNGAPGKVAVIRGAGKLTGADVVAPDIRGAAALVVAGLAAEGRTRMTNLYQLDRGYSGLEEMFAALGNPVRRIRAGEPAPAEPVTAQQTRAAEEFARADQSDEKASWKIHFRG